MRKAYLIALCMLIICTTFTMPTLAAPTVIFDDRQLFYVTPVIENNRTMVSLSVISKELGVDYYWNADRTIVTGVKDQNVLVMPIGSSQVTFNNKIYHLDAPARMVDNDAIAPLRFICEAYGAEVTWEKETQTVRITSPGATLPILKPAGTAPVFSGYVGSIKSHKYHLMNCSVAFQITPGDTVFFNSKDGAEAAGYERCNICSL